jgi:hypothetical protein
MPYTRWCPHRCCEASTGGDPIYCHYPMYYTRIRTTLLATHFCSYLSACCARAMRVSFVNVKMRLRPTGDKLRSGDFTRYCGEMVPPLDGESGECDCDSSIWQCVSPHYINRVHFRTVICSGTHAICGVRRFGLERTMRCAGTAGRL